jgi:hypothetical protein
MGEYMKAPGDAEYSEEDEANDEVLSEESEKDIEPKFQAEDAPPPEHQ